MTKKELDVGDFAFCSKGEIGLILWKHEQSVKTTGKKYVLYQGINLTPGDKWGLNWQSKSPKKATRSQLKKIMKGELVFYAPNT